jgi:hypothetical protein
MLQIHVVISLIAIVAGVLVTFGFVTDRRMNGWNAIFLLFTIATSVTGFLLPLNGLTPPVMLGIISLVVLVISVYARYAKLLLQVWRPAYVVTAMFAFYLNFFVLIAQSFQKLPSFHALAPTQTEPPFIAAQIGALVLFIILTIVSVKRYHPSPEV